MAPSEEDWIANKETIHDIYFQSTLPKLMERMETEFNFVASKNQYERKFKEWNIRKSVKCNNGEWPYILQKKRKRQELGKDSLFKLNGVDIAEAAIKKRADRYTLSETQDMQKFFAEFDPPTPKAISVRTPGVVETDMALSPESRLPDSTEYQCRTMGYFPNTITTAGSLQDRRSLSLCRVPLQITSRVVQELRLKRIPIHNLPYFQYVDLMKSKGHDALISSFSSNSTKENQLWSPIYQLLPFEHEDIYATDSILEQYAVYAPMISIEPLSDQFIWNTIFDSQNVQSIPPTTLETQKYLLARLSPLMLERDTGDLELQIQRLFGPSDMDAVLEFLNLIIYFSSNNEFQLRAKKSILDWTFRQSKRVLRQMFAIPLPTVQAFLMAMVDTAIKTQNFPVGRELLYADAQRKLYSRRPEQLLSVAVKLSHVELVRELVLELVHNEVDLNRAPYYIELKGELFLPSRGAKVWKRGIAPVTILGTASNVEVAKILLAAGADVNALHCGNYDYDDNEILSPIKRAARKGNSELVRLYIQHNADLNETSSESSTLFHAVATDSPELVTSLLDAGAHFFPVPQDMVFVRREDRAQKTELQLAASMGSVDLINSLLASELGIDELQKGKFGWAPLRDAAQGGHLEVVKLLISKGSDVNAKYEIDHASVLKGLTQNPTVGATFQYLPTTPLLAAVEGGHFEVVKVLIRNGANVNAVALGRYGSSALEAAHRLGHREIVTYLEDRGAIELLPPSEDDRIFALRLAAKRGDVESAQLLVNNGVDPACILDLIPHLRWGSPETLEFRKLSKKILAVFLGVCGGIVNVRGLASKETPLEVAFRIHDFAAALEIFRAGARDDAHTLLCSIPMRYYLKFPEGSGLSGFSRSDQIDMVELMKELWSATNSPIYLTRALQFSAGVGDFASVQHLVSLGADVNDQTWEDAGTALQPAEKAGTALQLAVHAKVWGTTKDYTTIEYLLTRGADVNAATKKVRSALQLAAEFDCELVKLLLDHGADVNAPASEDYGRTALQAAASSGKPSLDTINLLLDWGADINALPGRHGGVTALQGAAMNGHMKIAFMLLERGADPNAPGAEVEGRTALEGAAGWGRLDMVQLLLNAGAHPRESAAKFAEQRGLFVIADIIRDKLKGQEG